MFKELRFAARLLNRRPGFSALVILTMAIGIGAASTIFSVLNPVLLKTPPYPEASRIVSLAEKSQGRTLDATYGTFRELIQRAHSLESVSVFKTWQPSVTGGQIPERIDGQRVSEQYFRVLGVTPIVGRVFGSEADHPKGANEVVISDGLSRRLFGGARESVGREIKLDGVGFTVVGVMPSIFENVTLPSAEIWGPLQYDNTLSGGFNSREWGHHLSIIARLREEFTLRSAEKELDSISQNPLSEFPRPAWASLASGIQTISLQDRMTSGVRPTLLAISAAVLLLLIIAFVNTVNLLLARAAQREGEFALRSALGAGRRGIVRQLVAEMLLFASIACVVAYFIAILGVQTLLRLSPPNLPRREAIHVDSAVMIFAILLSVVAAVIAGSVPAFYALRGSLAASMQLRSRSIAAGGQSARRNLIVVEFALALILLVGASMLIQSVHRLFAVPTGFNASSVLTLQVQDAALRTSEETTNPEAKRSGEKGVGGRARFFEDALAAVRQVPGVADAGFTSQLPLTGQEDGYGVTFDDDPESSANGAYRYAVTPGYVKVMGIALLQGRPLNEQDIAGSQRVALISEALAKRRFGDSDPIGHTMRRAGTDQSFTIVGIVSNVKQQSLANDNTEAFYVPLEQWAWVDSLQTLVVRTKADPAALTNDIRAAIWSVNKDQPIVRIATMQSLVEASEAARRFALVLFNLFALVALCLAAIGIYGVLSGGVAERERELGVRLAFGATRRQLLALVLKEAAKLVTIGAAVGLVTAFAASRVLVSLLFEVSRFAWTAYLVSVVMLVLVAAIACALPAWRATKVDPAIVLRSE